MSKEQKNDFKTGCWVSMNKIRNKKNIEFYGQKCYFYLEEDFLEKPTFTICSACGDTNKLGMQGERSRRTFYKERQM